MFRSLHRRFIAYFIGIFSLPRVRDMVASSARLFAGEAGRMTTGIITEAAGTREIYQTLQKYVGKEKLTRAEKKRFKKQVLGLLKSAGVVVPVMLIPLPFVSTLLLILMDHLLLTLNIRILPDSFYPAEKKKLMTSEGVETDLKQLIGRKKPPAALILLVMAALQGLSVAQSPDVSCGELRRFPAFPSVFIDPRPVDVWLPPGFDPEKRYDVIYMQDGQNLFDTAPGRIRYEWGVDETMCRLLGERRVQPAIVVGIWNNGFCRRAEYFPMQALELMPAAIRDSLAAFSLANDPRSDDYLRFLVCELKPFIDSAFPTRKGRKHTFIAGSSSGALAALNAICSFPGVFCGAACLSTHWPGSDPARGPVMPAVPDALARWLDANLPSPRTHRLYFDLGTETLDSLYLPYQQRVDSILSAKGYRSRNHSTRFFPGDDHSERSWSRRLAEPMEFLLGVGKKDDE